MAYSKTEAKAKLVDFLQRYKRHGQEGKLSKLKEENTKDYIDELFRILGWDIIDDVIKEYGTGKRKRVDYAFHIGGTTKFLLEAKAYGERMQDKYISQTLQYGYQNNKTWVVLTNLREIRIYNARYFDKEEQIRQLFAPIKLDDALERFDDLWLLSREAMEHGLINQVASKYGKIRPREPIDRKIFEDLMEWRSLLTKNISKNNKFEGTTEEIGEKIDEAVQKMLDRIVFARVCEDRGLEEEGMLKWCITQSKGESKHALSKYLNRQFSRLNGVYNSGLFAPHFSEDLVVDDKTLEEIIEETYESPDGLRYDFSAIDADILGTVYEQYLGTLLKKTEKRATLRSEKAQRKKMGIYYTPTYIVEYIVKKSLGEKLKKCKKPEDALKIKVLDPACGSGSFLIRAYEEFKQWFEAYKAKNGKGGEQTILSGEDKKGLQTFMDRVLENCIYGVDLDSKAVELAQLNLLLKAAEDRHKLPKLDHTIQNGNSLVDDKGVARKLAFDWKEKFPEVFKHGGFDVVIGNPPYLSMEDMGASDREYYYGKTGQKKNFYVAQHKTNLYAIFWEQVVEKLCKDGGEIGFLTPYSWFSNTSFENLRKVFLEKTTIKELVTFPVGVFDAGIATCIHIVSKSKAKRKSKTGVKKISSKELKEDLDLSQRKMDNRFEQELMKKNEGFIINVDWNPSFETLKKKFKTGRKLGDFITIHRGCDTANNKKYVFASEQIDKEPMKKLIRGEDFGRYSLCHQGYYLWYNPQKMKKEKSVARPGEEQRFETEEKIILYRFLNDKNGFISTYDSGKHYCLGSTYVLSKRGDDYDLKFVLGLLNSKLMAFLNYNYFKSVKVTRKELENIPIKNWSKKEQEGLIKLVDKIMAYKEEYVLLDKNSNEAQRKEIAIEKTDAEIDQLVYKLYDLTKEEIRSTTRA